jgi:hypothetical protein
MAKASAGASGRNTPTAGGKKRKAKVYLRGEALGKKVVDVLAQLFARVNREPRLRAVRNQLMGCIAAVEVELAKVEWPEEMREGYVNPDTSEDE